MVDTKTPADKVAEGAGADSISSPDGNATPASRKRKRKKIGITVGAIVAIIAVAGAGFAVWHEQPSFCNAICHTPMDAYLPTYEATASQAAVDKWGNNVANAAAMMAPLHREKAKTTCMGCHVPTISEQLSEGMSWVSGNYEVYATEDGNQVVPERTLEMLTDARGLAPEQFCLNSSCHNLDRQHLALETDDMERNPHAMPRDANHTIKYDCGDCHKAHRASINQCSTCHNDADIPEGWLTAIEAGKTAKGMAS